MSRSAQQEAGPWDVVIAGGGPTGATAGLRAARHGLRVVILEQANHPRFQIGESLLPCTLQQLCELGLEASLSRLPRVRKIGGSFMLGHEREPRDYHFANGLLDASPETFNVERAPFDRWILDEARQAGVEVLEGVTVRRILRLEEGAVAVEATAAGSTAAAPMTIAGRYLLDATGQRTLVGRHLGTRRTLPDLRRIAYFGHFRGIPRRPDALGGYPLIVMCREGWFWFIPIDDQRTSVGLVVAADTAERAGVAPRDLLHWALERCPATRDQVRHAEQLGPGRITADFSYTCRPYAGPGYFLIGDAATFIDPIFSTGVCMGLKSAVHVADAIRDLLAGSISPRAARRRYCRFVGEGSAAFFRIVRWSYRHEFRELFLHGIGPARVHAALTSVLCGHVFPRPAFALRWRMRLFGALIAVHRRVALTTRRSEFSLIDGEGPAAA